MSRPKNEEATPKGGRRGATASEAYKGDEIDPALQLLAEAALRIVEERRRRAGPEDERIGEGTDE